MKRNLLLLFVFLLITNSHAQDEITADSLGFGFKAYNEGQAYTAIAFDSINKRVWAGTTQNGVFNLDTSQPALPIDFTMFSGSASGGQQLSNLRIKSMAADKLGSIWIGHEGINTSGGAGGMEQINSNLTVNHYSPDRNFRGFSFFERDGLGTLRLNAVTVDKNDKVWVAQRYHDLTSSPNYYVTPGVLSFKAKNDLIFSTKGAWWPDTNIQPVELPYPAYTYNPKISESPQTRNMQGISTDNSSVWVGVYPYVPDYDENVYIPARVIRYDLSGNHMPSSGATAHGGFSFADMGIPAGGVVNGICANNNKGTWVTTSFTGKGFAVFKNDSWFYIDPSNFTNVIAPGTRFNDNAIWKNNYGNVFMGTTNGLLVYDGRGPIEKESSYTLYSKTALIPNSPFVVVDTDMVSNNITAGVSQNDGIQWMATVSGIMRSQIGYIKYNANVGVCPALWRDVNSNFSDNSDLEQCTFSQDKSTNPIVMDVEAKIKAGIAAKDNTYHRYQINTPVAYIGNKYATVENVFHMLKEHARFQAIIPYDFPNEVLGDEFLEEITHEHVKKFEDIANTSETKITSVRAIMDMDSELASYGDITNVNFKTWGGFLLTADPWALLSRKVYFNRQIEVNPEKSIHEEQTYLLYNTPDVSGPRAVFSNFYNLPFVGVKASENCEGTGLESPAYDPVIMHIDDTNYTITNYTKAGHYFHPGKITRTVLRDQTTGNIYIRTIGEGLHFCKGNLGEFSGKLNTMMGVILFKNVDLRLREKILTLN